MLPVRNWLIGIVVVLLVAMFSWVGVESTFAWTNTRDFCISCHEMESTVYEEFKGTIHDVNAAGVTATCADCHVPKIVFGKFFAKLRASKDVYHHLLGTIDTSEKFEARRLHMAERVWDYMRETDSRECRNCHVFGSMDLDSQVGRAARKHVTMRDPVIDNRATCIDCHKGVAHEMPMDYEGD